MKITLISFAYGKGIPENSTMVFNARFLKPPHAEPELRKLTGRDKPVQEFLRTDKDLKNFFKHMLATITIFTPRYGARYGDDVVISVGCTGGQHRSVFLVEELAKVLGAVAKEIVIDHRELERMGML